MTTTFRADIVAAVIAILEEESAANPTLLRKVYSSRPGSFGETPCAYIGAHSESITHDAGTRTRTFDGLTFTVVDTYRDNTQTGDLLDELVDNLVDRFDLATNVQRVARSILALTSVADADIVVEPGGDRPTVLYRGVVFTLGGTYKPEGRQ